jgi:hypothetical protein
VHGEPRDLILKPAGEPGAVPRPRDRRDDHAVLAAAHTRGFSLDIGERRPEIERPPPTPSITEIEARTPTPANPAPITLPPPRPNRDDYLPLIAAVHVLNNSSGKAKQPGP